MWRIWAAALFWGLNWPAVKLLLDGAGPWTLRAAGLGAGGVLLAIVARALGHSLKVERAWWGKLLLAGLLNVAGFSMFAVFAQLSMTASRAAILTYTMPLWSVVFARLMIGEAIDRLRAIALTLGGVGIACLIEPFMTQMRAGEVPLGLIFVMAAAITWALGTVYTKQAKIPGEPMVLTSWQLVIGGAVGMLGMAMFETPRLELWRPEIAVLFAYHCILPQAAAYALWFSLMARVPASTAALGTLLVPVFAVASSMAWIGERPAALDLVGFALILAAILLDQGVRGWRGQTGAKT